MDLIIRMKTWDNTTCFDLVNGNKLTKMCFSSQSSFLDLAGFWNTHQQIMSKCVRWYNVEIMLGKGMGDDDWNKILCHMPSRSPRLPEAEYNTGSGRRGFAQGVVLKCRSECVVVVKDHCALVLLKRLALKSGRVAIIHHRTAKGSSVDVIVVHFNQQSLPHCLEEIIG